MFCIACQYIFDHVASQQRGPDYATVCIRQIIGIYIRSHEMEFAYDERNLRVSELGIDPSTLLI